MNVLIFFSTNTHALPYAFTWEFHGYISAVVSLYDVLQEIFKVGLKDISPLNNVLLKGTEPSSNHFD